MQTTSSKSATPAVAPSSRAPQCTAATAGSSNSAQLESTGLAVAPEVEAAADGSIATGLSLLGANAGILLSALPATTGFSAALDNWHLPASREWLAEQPVKEVTALPSSLMVSVINKLWPVNAFAEVSLTGGVSNPLFAALEAGATVNLARTQSGLTVGVAGRLSSFVGANADAGGKAWAKLGAEQGAAVELDLAFDFTSLSEIGGSLVGGGLTSLFTAALLKQAIELIDPYSGSARITRFESVLDASVGLDAGMAVGSAPAADAPVLPGEEDKLAALGQIALKGVAARVNGQFQYRVGVVNGHPRWVLEVSASAPGAYDEQSGQIESVGCFARLELISDFSMSVAALVGEEQSFGFDAHVTLGTRRGGEETRTQNTYRSIDEAIAAVAGGMDSDEAQAEARTLGTLVQGTKHTVQDPEVAQGLVERVGAGVLGAAAMGASVTIDAEVAVEPGAAVSAGFPGAGVDPEATLEGQREVARQALGECAPDSQMGEHLTLRKAEVEVKTPFVSQSLTAPNIRGLPTGFGVDGPKVKGKTGSKRDLAGELSLPEVTQLLSA